MVHQAIRVIARQHQNYDCNPEVALNLKPDPPPYPNDPKTKIEVTLRVPNPPPSPSHHRRLHQMFECSRVVADKESEIEWDPKVKTTPAERRKRKEDDPRGVLEGDKRDCNYIISMLDEGRSFL